MTEYESVIQKGPATKAEERRERAVLVGVERPGLPWPLESSLAELERLADTAGADVVATTTQRLDAPTRAPSSARARPTKSPSWHDRTRPTSSSSTMS